jgi:hypothetical protein
MREILGATCSLESVGVHYPMPAASLCVGAFVGHKCQGTTAVGCAVRMGGGQTWIAPGSPVASNIGVRRSRRRTANAGKRVWFGSGSVSLELLQGNEWRRLGTSDTVGDEGQAVLWASRGMQWEIDIIVTSNGAHCNCRTRVRLPCSCLVQSDVPDEDTSRLRHELEGVGLGFEEHIQQAERFAFACC